MLNELIRNTNALAHELEKGVSEDVKSLTEEFNGSLARTLQFISDNSVPADTVSTMEDRLVRELLKKERESQIRADAARAKSEYETIKKETDWCARGVSSGMGNAELKYLEMKARMDDFEAETAHMTKEARMNNVGTFNALYAEYLAAKSEFEKVGNSDAQALAENLEASKQKLSEAEVRYNECKVQLARIPLKLSDIDYESGSGVVTKALKAEREEIRIADEKRAAENKRKDKAQPSSSSEAAIKSAELTTVRDEAYAELVAFKKEMESLRAEAAELKKYIAEAKAAVTTIEKARQAATVSAKRAIAIAERLEKSTEL